MIPKDCNKQIISNEPSAWDVVDTMHFQFENCVVEGVSYAVVEIDYANGKVVCFDNVNKTYAIKVTLEPVTE